VWEVNSQGSIPYVPYLRAPFYAWIGRPWGDAAKQLVHEQRVEAPPLFPPTFLYTQSWEDPEPDMEVGLVLLVCGFFLGGGILWVRRGP
jgi:betaine lipid synthase